MHKKSDCDQHDFMKTELRPPLNAKPFQELYQLEKELGRGSFSKVREGFSLCRNNNSGNDTREPTSYAVKCINRKKLSENDQQSLRDEVAILNELHHIQIIRLHDFFEEKTQFYLVMEQAKGGELFDRILAKGKYSEKEARETFQNLLQAVKYLHSHNIAHRDLKPDNILLSSKDDDTNVKVADFGFAKKVQKPNSLKTLCGTLVYLAPEVYNKVRAYDERVDMWSMGVILYVLLSGYLPFQEESARELSQKIRNGKYEFHKSFWRIISKEAKHLIVSLLQVNPTSRSSALQALDHPWIHGTTLTQKDAMLFKKDTPNRLNLAFKLKANAFPVAAARSMMQSSAGRINFLNRSRAR